MHSVDLLRLWLCVTSICVTSIVVMMQAANGESWPVKDQPGLKQALERAPVLRTESLGEPSRGVLAWVHSLAPNPDGKTWDALQWYFKDYTGPTWLHSIDLGTGEVKKQRFRDNHQIYLSGQAIAPDGKLYIVQPGSDGRGWQSMFLQVYDPATNTLEDRGEIVPNLRGEVRPIVLGPDGRLYGTGTYLTEGKVGLYIYDPKLRKVVKNFGPVGPKHSSTAYSYYGMGVDDTHAYIASGMLPRWYLVAVNLKTGEDKVLLESPDSDHRIYVGDSLPGAWATVLQRDGAPDKRYWLYHGKAIARVDDTPPWPKKASLAARRGPEPEAYWEQITPDADGNATFWYRLPADAAKAPKTPPADAKPEKLGWKSIRLKDVETHPYRLDPLTLLPDGRLYSAGEYGYSGSFVYDPKSGKATLLALGQGMPAPYASIVYGDKLFVSGYSNGALVVYDPNRPWTLLKAGPPGHPAPKPEDPASNPRALGIFSDSTRVAVMHSAARGADGKIYFGGFGERHYTGGGFGWYDPKTEKLDGFWKPFSGFAIHWIASLQGGRLIAISTAVAQDELHENRVPKEAKLFFYDVEQGKIVKDIVPIEKARTTGLITEVAPGLLLGLTVDTADPEHPGVGILYGLEAATGKVLFRKALPWPVGLDGHWPHWVDPPLECLDLVRGPDGFLWTYLKDVLVRIDPKDASVHVVGKLAPVGHPTFVGNDIYFSGAEQLRRIRNVAQSAKTSSAGSP